MPQKSARAIIGRVANLAPGRVITKNDFADHALVFGEMGFLNQVVVRVVAVFRKKTKLLLRSINFTAHETSVFIQVIANSFANFSIWRGGGGDGFVSGVIGFVDRARTIGVKKNTDADRIGGRLCLGEEADRDQRDNQRKKAAEKRHGAAKIAIGGEEEKNGEIVLTTTGGGG